MSGINRRTMIGLVGAAGAGVVLSGCDDRKKRKVLASKSKPVGYCDVAGQSVRDLKPKTAGNVTGFAPRYICIVYARFDASWKLTVRRTYIGPLTIIPSPAQVEGMAQQVLAKLAAGNSYNQHDKADIDPIHLGSQQIVVFYIDNPPDKIRFKYNPTDTNNGNNNSYDRTIRFVKFSASDQPLDIKENNAFFNVLKMNIVRTGTSLKSNVAFRMDFWNSDEMGNEIKNVDPNDPDTHYLYSMNIHLEIVSPVSPTSEKWIPIILDPDTGNMGAEP